MHLKKLVAVDSFAHCYYRKEGLQMQVSRN
jgi:hypothetical protein